MDLRISIIMTNIAPKKGMKEIQIKGNRGSICVDNNPLSDKLRIIAFDSNGHIDSHYVFNPETISKCSSITYVREGGRTRFYDGNVEVSPCECDYPVSS